MSDVPPVIRFRIQTPQWIESLFVAEPEAYIDREMECEMKVPLSIRERFDFSEMMVLLSRLSKYAQFEIELMLDEKSYRNRNK